MLLNTSLGCIVFLISNLSLLYSSHLIARRFFPNSPHSVRIVGIGVLYYAFIILLFQALSPLHAITKTWVTIACIITALVSHLLWGALRNVKVDMEPINSWIKDGLSSPWASLIIISGFVILLSLSRALLMPPLAWDCLTYHLTLAATWIKKGTLLRFEAPYQMQNVYFPINGEIFASWLLLPFHTDLIANCMNFPITFLGGVACYAIAKELGLNRKEASFAPALICFAPVIYAQITTEYLDNAAFAFCAISTLFTIRFLWRGYTYDGFLAFLSAGINLGIKYSVIPTVCIVIATITIKTITPTKQSNFLSKLSLILAGFLLVCALGGRQYLINTIEAGNPLYPLPLTLFNITFEGREALDVEEKWENERKKDLTLADSNLWEQEYRKFCYLPLAAGPKFFFFLVIAIFSIFYKPHSIPGRCWYFLYIMWIVPIIIIYTTTTATIAREAPGDTVNTRYFSSYIALFTTQGLIALKPLFRHSRIFKCILVAFVGWDLLHINKNHFREIEVLYPIVALLIPLMVILYQIGTTKVKMFGNKFNKISIACNLLIGNGTLLKHLSVWVFSLISLVSVFNLLQDYRDATRYNYFRTHTDYHNFPRTFIDGWEFLDQVDEKKTVALTMAWSPPGTHCFFYPLMGRWLQNDAVYVSAKYKWDVPTWFHKGSLEGRDFSIWLHNIRRKEVDYIFVQKPWPIETSWMQGYKDKFQLVFSDPHCKIFQYKEKDDSYTE